MRIENRRDMSLAMSRNTRRARAKMRANVKTYPASKMSSGSSLKNDLLSKAAGSQTNPLSNLLTKNNYNTVNTAAKAFQKEAEKQLVNKKSQKADTEDVERGVELYNSLIAGMNRVSSSAMQKYTQEMKTYLDKNEKAFQEMGIQIKADGTLQTDVLRSKDADMAKWYEFLEKASIMSAKTQVEAQSSMYGLGKNRTIYGTSYDRYGKESI